MEFLNLHWAVLTIPVVLIGGVIVYYVLHAHKEKKSTDHVLKL